ncbi:unnamed protein product [Candidula unifasciata]|uniref:Uncharacterized protein n=1 Tax=Candidula unifasciata TaxID=100452 RepID=A0A8S3Z0L5_9EUPU|nr:unnamed protein product [Candidula unifasciata]
MPLETALSAVLAGLTVLLLYASVMIMKRQSRKYEHIPMVTPRIPLVGNATSLDMSCCHTVLTGWATTFGPIFRIKLFQEEILVLNNFDSVYEALVVKGSDFAGRPPMYRTLQAGRHRHSIVWQTYTDKLQFLRKEVLKSLKMYGGGCEQLQQRSDLEISHMLEHIGKCSGADFNPWHLIYEAVSNVMLRLTLGTHLDQSSPSFQAIKDINHLFNDTFGPGQAGLIDFLPWLGHLGYPKFRRRLQAALTLRDQFWQQQLQLLKEQDSSECIVQTILSLISDPKTDHMDITEATAKEVFTNLILAGTDTTASALTCLLLVFLHNPDVQDKIWAEIRTHVGESRLVSLADRANMPYMQAVLLELLRYISHVPLAVPHYTIRDTCVQGIHVPKDMTVYINLWSVHHHPADWDQPWTFLPERFLDQTGQLLPLSSPTRKRLLMFGAGRRVCLGEILAKNSLFLFAAALVQNFRFVSSAKDERSGQLPPVDPRTYEMGLVLHPRPFQLRAIPRH